MVGMAIRANTNHAQIYAVAMECARRIERVYAKQIIPEKAVNYNVAQTIVMAKITVYVLIWNAFVKQVILVLIVPKNDVRKIVPIVVSVLTVNVAAKLDMVGKHVIFVYAQVRKNHVAGEGDVMG